MNGTLLSLYFVRNKKRYRSKFVVRIRSTLCTRLLWRIQNSATSITPSKIKQAQSWSGLNVRLYWRETKITGEQSGVSIMSITLSENIMVNYTLFSSNNMTFHARRDISTRLAGSRRDPSNHAKALRVTSTVPRYTQCFQRNLISTLSGLTQKICFLGQTLISQKTATEAIVEARE